MLTYTCLLTPAGLLGQGLQHFDVHPVLLASATLMSIIKKNELDKLTDAITLLEYIHSQFPLVMPRALSALLVAIKTKVRSEGCSKALTKASVFKLPGWAILLLCLVLTDCLSPVTNKQPKQPQTAGQ